MQHPPSRHTRLPVLRRLCLIFLAAALALPGLPAGPAIAAEPLVVVNTDDSGDGSLRKLLEETVAGDTIVFDAGLSGDTIALGAPLALLHDLTIDASALADPIILDGQDATRVFEVAEDVNVTLRGLTITNGYAVQEAGGIRNRGNLTISECTLSGNAASGDSGITATGGAILNDGALTVFDSAFTINRAGTIDLFTGARAGHGGAIYSTEGAGLVIAGSTFEGNAAIGLGGAIHSLGALEVAASVFSGNGAVYGSGAAIHHAGAEQATVDECAFAENQSSAAPGTGLGAGTIHNEGLLAVSGSLFTENEASGGGGIANRATGTLRVSTSLFSTNAVDTDGGGIMSQGALVAEDCTFSANTAGNSGGAMAVSIETSEAGSIAVTRCTVEGNSAAMGGGMVHIGGSLEVQDSTFRSNTADQGGAVVTTGTATVRRTAFIGNTATLAGGAVVTTAFVPDSHLTVTNSTFSGNTAGDRGGAIAGAENSNLTLTHATMVDNAATNGGGGIAAGGFALVTNSIVRSTAAQGGACLEMVGVITGTHNLVSDATCGPWSTEDPLLGPLGDNGGPTSTYELLEGSPAVGAASPLHCVTPDQRGVARPQGEGCDIGAFEAAPPQVRTDPAEAVSAGGATLHGAMLPLSWAATAAFEYGETTAYGATVAATSGAITGTAEIPLSHALTGLLPHTTYHYRLVAENAIGSARGKDETFTTAAIPPTVATGAATGAAADSATLHATVNAHNDDATAAFEYGLTTSYGATVAASPSPVTGREDETVSAALTGLLPNTTYHYRVVAENSADEVVGGDRTFATRAAPLAVTGPPTGITADGATLHGTVTARNAEAAVWFEYGLSTEYGAQGSATPASVTGLEDTAVTLGLTGLLPNTTYHYRVVAENATGTTYGQDRTFATDPAAPTVSTGSATGVSATGAVLHGAVNARNAATDVWFEYGPRGGSTLSAAAAPATATGLDDTAVTLTLTGLAPKTEYVYRLVAENAAGTAEGAEETFTTAALPDDLGHRILLPLVQR